jgi:hypothetical protein
MVTRKLENYQCSINGIAHGLHVVGEGKGEIEDGDF